MSVEARPGADDPYVALQETEEFQDLRKKFRGFVFPMTAFFLAGTSCTYCCRSSPPTS